MKVIEMKAENFKVLTAVDITPKGEVVIISGANAQGKSTVLDLLWAGIDSAGYMKATKTSKPIKNGEKKAVITLSLGNNGVVELIVTRKFLPSGITVELSKPDGSFFKKPQEILDALTGAISFDPLGFASLDSKKQKAQLLGLVDIGMDLDKWELDRKTVYDARTDKNRAVSEKEALFLSFSEPEEGTPDEETPASEIIGRMNMAAAKRQELDNTTRDTKGKLSQALDDIARMKEKDGELYQRELDLERQISALRDQLKQVGEDRAGLKGAMTTKEEAATLLESEVEFLSESPLALEVEALPTPESFQAELESLDETNKKVRAKKERQQAYDAYQTLKVESDSMTADLERMEKERNDAIKAAKFPVEGLGFDDNGITFDGLPFTQASSAQRLRVSLAIAIALNPRLRVLRITDGSLLDSKNMAIIREMCAEHDYQAWVEVVDETGKMGIYIEDGAVSAEN